MRRYLGILALLLLAAPAYPQPAAPKSFDLKAIDKYVEQYVADKGTVGLSVAIMRDGKVVFAKGYGFRNLESKQLVEPETSFAVGSITKQFTCACILLLAEDGKLSVNDPVAKYFPNLTRAKDITLLDLMNHTSGYPDYYPLDFLDRRMLKSISLEGLCKDYAAVKLDFEPGSRFSYSNTGYIILGGVVEKITGGKFADFLQKRILRPLKMEHSQFGTSAGLPSPATGYTAFALDPSAPAKPEADGWIEAAGGLWASASDLLKWDLALVEGKVLKPESYELMIKPRKLSNGKMSDYGCGLRVGFLNGDPILVHTGGVSGFVSYNSVLPRTRSGLVVLSNTEHISVQPMRAVLAELLAKDIEAKEAPAVPKIDGPSPREVVTSFIKELAEGKLDRSKLGEEFSIYLTEEKVKSSSAKFKDLGAPETVEPGSANERGGMEVVSVKVGFKGGQKMRASLYRTPDGKIQQLLLYAE